jgi:light-regulated signal transduction histidine kinase (bacteriophytochrome)
MKALINGLLEYSRLGNQVLETEKIDLADLLEALRFQFERHIQDLGASLEMDPLPKDVQCNPVQMGRLFQNLISNALKFRRPDIPPVIRIHYEDQDSSHYFSVEDNGIGIKEAHFDRLFVIFNRLNLREKYEGNGLGLTIVKRIVERHHGKVWVSSTYGEGTTIHFTIPKEIPAD